MRKDVNPLIAVLVVLIALGAVWVCYAYVFHGKQFGQAGPPASLPGPTTPGKAPDWAPYKTGPTSATKGARPAPPKAGKPANAQGAAPAHP